MDPGTAQVGTPGLGPVAEEPADHPVELPEVDSSPESVFGACVEMRGEDIEIPLEMVCKQQKPRLVGGTNIEDSFEEQRSGRLTYRRGRIEKDTV